ncbi:MAG: putative metal-binding motif-containing protein, partial [Vicinamibacterales bacterium]|nr:putative metal-binding motif-containing protein [Vicinamibacterales bacterium]
MIPPDELDGDGDGVSTCAGDCDDTNAAINPSATEVCNGVDDDCDGLVPDDELDLDGDGASTCAGDCDDGDAGLYLDDLDGDGLSPCDGDCDDADATIYDGATELCNGFDDDCDGDVDEDDALDALTWYEDADGDGFGDPAAVTAACDPPPDHVDLPGDCDDGDA